MHHSEIRIFHVTARAYSIRSSEIFVNVTTTLFPFQHTFDTIDSEIYREFYRGLSNNVIERKK